MVCEMFVNPEQVPQVKNGEQKLQLLSSLSEFSSWLSEQHRSLVTFSE